jgi:chromosome segregation ATPase
VDTDIPDELHRLEMQRTDVKTRYKMLTRRRTSLLGTLTSHLDGTEPEDPTFALRLVENLKEISSELDRLAEDLHSADEQIAQLTSLRDVHSASALAMALRKLNASFLKQISEADELRARVEILQAERDEAWNQAVDVANEYDDLNERIDVSSPGASNQSRRSSRVLAVKKSSIRVSKAGLRSSSRRSSVSSIGGQRFSSSSGLPSATMEDIPPVPPIPRRRPEDIRTDFSSRVSAVSFHPFALDSQHCGSRFI